MTESAAFEFAVFISDLVDIECGTAVKQMMLHDVCAYSMWLRLSETTNSVLRIAVFEFRCETDRSEQPEDKEGQRGRDRLHSQIEVSHGADDSDLRG